MEDCIIVSGLEVMAQVGVPAWEREAAQRLVLSLVLVPERGLGGVGDEIGNTVDYAVVCEAVREEAEARPRHLIETLAEEVAGGLLRRFPLRAVDVEVRKYVVAGTEYVGVRVRRDCK